MSLTDTDVLENIENIQVVEVMLVVNIIIESWWTNFILDTSVKKECVFLDWIKIKISNQLLILINYGHLFLSKLENNMKHQKKKYKIKEGSSYWRR